MRVKNFILIIFVFLGCSSKSKIPEDVLSQKKMQAIIWDLVRADEYVNNDLKKYDSLDLKSERIGLYEQIFRLHSVTADKVKKSLAFYQTRPDLLKVITDSLQNEERKIQQKQVKENMPRSDSSAKKPETTPVN